MQAVELYPKSLGAVYIEVTKGLALVAWLKDMHEKPNEALSDPKPQSSRFLFSKSFHAWHCLHRPRPPWPLGRE